ncbi:unnamed protein product [Calicophoron daubneyi]|uniref:Ig-like domain-containing protein n=1 Tax=Calicophoron daubneyi TaxID=300641 RepID=A0AAV2TJ44_CALDB
MKQTGRRQQCKLAKLSQSLMGGERFISDIWQKSAPFESSEVSRSLPSPQDWQGLVYFVDLWLVVFANCKPGPNGQFVGVQLAGPPNVTAPLGTDVQFICCGGYKWTYESDGGYQSREIGSHPDAAGAPEKQQPDAGILLTPELNQDKTTAKTQTTVYTMHDDKGRLILTINNAGVHDMGHYRCHGHSGEVDAFLVVTAERYSNDSEQSTVVARGSVLKRYLMFPSNNDEQVIIQCPVKGTQTIQMWMWREPILPTSKEYAQVPEGKLPSRMVTANRPGSPGGKYVEIGPNLAWAKILDPLSPEAPRKLWCQFEVPSAWTNAEPIDAYYELDWELYAPITPKIYILPVDVQEDVTLGISELPKTGLGKALGGSQTPWDEEYLTDPSTLMNEIEKAQLLRQSGQRQILLEQRPARLVCQFRPVEDVNSGQGQAHKFPLQQVYWYRDDQPIHVPPFHVDNSLVATKGISILNVRAYPALFEAGQKSTDKPNGRSQDPIEKITCTVISQVKDKPLYKVTTNSSLEVEVVLFPRIINKELLSTERSVDDAVKLTCTAIANGPPEMQFEFNPKGKSEKQDVPEWYPVLPRSGLNLRRLKADASNPTVERLVLDISDLRRTDHGLYRCSVWNQAGRAQAIGQVLVRSSPEVDVIPFESNYFVGHKPWKASCHVTGYPLASAATGNLQTKSTETKAPELNEIVTQPTTTLSETGLKPVQMKIFAPDWQPMDRVEVTLVDYVANEFLGINATYEVQMSQRLGSEAVVRCEYTHTDQQKYNSDVFLHEATRPTGPNISVLCVGPRAVVFGVTNPRAGPGSPPTERIVTQKIMFAPAKIYHSAPKPASMLVYLDSEGQPSASPTNVTTTDGEPHVTLASGSVARPHTAVIPVTGLMADAEYVFEWTSGNVFGLTVMVQFTLSTTKLEEPPNIKNIVFLKPTTEYIRFSVFLADPCPYSGGGRAELSDMLVRYRAAEPNTTDTSSYVGVGEWSEMQTCKNLEMVNDVGSAESNGKEADDQLGINWAGDVPLPCELPVKDPQETYEIQVATRNRFEKSNWYTSMYQPAKTVLSASLCYPPCGSVRLTFGSLVFFITCLLHLLRCT